MIPCRRRPRFAPYAVLASLLTLGAAPSVAAAQARTAATVVDSIFGLFDETTPGAAVSVVHEGEVVFRAGYGMADLEHGIRIGPETVFDIASVSKQFTGMAIATLVEEGRIDLDREARGYLEELPDFGAPLTIRHLVHHTSGIRDWPATLALAGWRMDDVISFDQILRMAWSQRELNFPSGDDYSYSNTGYNLLAETVSRVTGTSFRDWTAERIFEPLGMTSTHFQDDHREIVPNKAQGYTLERGGWVTAPNGLTALGSSSLHSSVDDLARWLIDFDTHEVAAPDVVRRMRERGVLNSGDTIAYAFGLSRGEYRGRRTWSHSGSWAGYRTLLLHLPELEAGVVVLSNSGVYNPTLASYSVADAFFGEDLDEPVQRGDNAGSPRGQTADAPRPSAAELAAYVGTWVSQELDTRYELSVSEGALVAEHWRHGTIELTPRAPDVFIGSQWFFQPVRFVRDDAGSVSEMLVGAGRARDLRFLRGG